MRNNLRMLGLTLCVLPMYLQPATGQDLKPVYQPAKGRAHDPQNRFRRAPFFLSD